MEEQAKDYSHINGWGIDADPKNDPTYPMKHRTNEEHKGYSWERPPQQPITMEVLHSIERPNVTAVYGTAMPPSGLSGMIRRFAFKHSENSYLHWLPLLVADRVNVVEGLIEDVAEGKVPNIFSEKGYSADWDHNRSGLAVRAAVGAAVVGAVVLMCAGEKNRKRWFNQLMDR
ncbi:hypothetical protein C8N40_102496 [Pontibacter mucosus]|uniref:Uncharacterized protein n=1 Tax=Pontibacter mucosus TaxID=1649266 RepID=A0A2T5YQD3_9BACT|nr:hypothetical protein [Pontibacter mucosus]PTX21520.1 hypothetical protein C8N40_102496 [Pontibacter mucosus]